MVNPKKRAITLVLNPDVYGALAALAQTDASTVSKVIELAIAEYIRDKTKTQE